MGITVRVSYFDWHAITIILFNAKVDTCIVSRAMLQCYHLSLVLSLGFLTLHFKNILVLLWLYTRDCSIRVTYASENIGHNTARPISDTVIMFE